MTESISATIAGFDSTLNIARQSLYRFAALALADPRIGNWTKLANANFQALLGEAANVVRDEPDAVADPLARGEAPLEKLDPLPVFGQLPRTAPALNATYERVFGLLVSGACPPHGTEYVQQKLTFQRSHALADIAGFYAAFGLKISANHPERHDHIALELEFMACLLGLEHRAIVKGGPAQQERIDVCRAAQSEFFATHIAWWVPTFARLLSLEDTDGFYDIVGRFLAALIPAERALLGVEAPRQGAAPSKVEPPEACDGCALASA